MAADRMAAHDTAALDRLKPKMLAATLRPGAKADPKPLGDARLGQAIERALALANLTKQEVSFAMGYTDQSSISKWIAEKEPPRLDKLWRVKKLRVWLVVALGEEAGCGVRMTISVRRSG